MFGNLYGTSASDTERLLAAGDDVVLVIDVQGARQVRRRGVPAATIFVMPPSFDVLERRLRGQEQGYRRSHADPAQVAREEVAAFTEYDYIVINDEVRRAVSTLQAIVIERSEARLRRMRKYRRKHRTDVRMLIALGVTGGIGAYKAVEVARRSAEARSRGRGHHDRVGDAIRRALSPSKPSPAGASSPTSSSLARTPKSSTSRWPRPSTCCSSRRPRPTSSESSPTVIADDFLSTLYTATRAPGARRAGR